MITFVRSGFAVIIALAGAFIALEVLDGSGKVFLTGAVTAFLFDAVKDGF